MKKNKNNFYITRKINAANKLKSPKLNENIDESNKKFASIFFEHFSYVICVNIIKNNVFVDVILKTICAFQNDACISLTCGNFSDVLLLKKLQATKLFFRVCSNFLNKN